MFAFTARIAGIALLTSVLMPNLAAAQDDTVAGKLTVELNKFEDNETGGCRAFFLFRNKTEMTLEGFEMSLAILDTNGIIDRLLTIDAAPIQAARTTLKLFEVPDIACSDISEILLHELASCKPQNADEMDCFPILDLNSRTTAALVK